MPTHHLDFVANGGEIAELIRAKDWSTSALGPPATWPQSLRSTVSLMLTAPEPAYIFWGADPVLLYNDLGLPFVGAKHPASLGEYVRVALAEAWPVIGR
jgi:hypothetical protein